MRRLDSGQYLVPALRASQAIDLVRNYFTTSRAPTLTALKLDSYGMEGIWLVQPTYSQVSADDDSELATADWVSTVTPQNWNVVFETKQGLLVIRNPARTVCMVQTILTSSLLRGQLRRAFAQLGVQIE